MDTTHRIIITAVLAGILGSLITLDNSQADAELASAAPEAMAFDNATPEQIELVNDAIETFAAAQLELPPLVIRFDPTGELCHGHGGLFHQATPATITICAGLEVASAVFPYAPTLTRLPFGPGSAR